MENRTGLSLELVAELRDRQRNEYAQTTFSEAVEMGMKENGDDKTAEWCRLIRSWYAAVDAAGMDITDRIEYLLNMRSFLLQFYKPGTFPPPGAYIAGLPITQFEGFMTNVDRRLQLYAFTRAGSFNQRSVTSLDSETMFGSFQVLTFFMQLACIDH